MLQLFTKVVFWGTRPIWNNSKVGSEINVLFQHKNRLYQG